MKAPRPAIALRRKKAPAPPKAPRATVGLRTRLCHLSVAVVAALAATLGCLIDRRTGATIRSSSIAGLDQAQRVIAERAVGLLERGGGPELQKLLEDVVAAAPFEMAACFSKDGRLRAAASRAPFTPEREAALERYGASNSIGTLAHAWGAAGIRFLEHPLLDPARTPEARGALLLATDPPAVERRIAAIRRCLWGAAAIGGGVAALAVLLLARALTRPLLAFVEDVGRLEQGLPVRRRATSRRDEIGLLARAFDRMARDVESCRQELKGKGERLAQAVARRKESLGEALRGLEQLGRRKDAFLSSISHELRTPLTVLKGSAEILAESDDPAALAEFLPGMREHAQELDRLVGNLLLLDELERCERVAMPRRSTLGALVEAALAEVEPERARRSAAVARDLDGRLVVRWDLFLAARLLRELLLNAVRFSPGGGRVSLRARAEAARVLLTVEDEGPGIPARQCEAVFERFQQLGDVLTEKPRGAGLGLPICRAIAVLHGGWIRAEPRAPAPGARFVLELPIDASAGWRSEEAPEDILAMLRP